MVIIQIEKELSRDYHIMQKVPKIVLSHLLWQPPASKRQKLVHLCAANFKMTNSPKLIDLAKF